jgi:uncharacterized protein
MEQLPYWRVAMERRKDSPRWQRMVADSAGVIDDVRAALRDRGPLGNRDFESSHYQLGTGYRTGKLTGFALYAMWLAGEVMTHSRRGFDRIYDFTENVAPREHQWIASPDEADRFFTRHAIALKGMSDAKALRLWVSEMHNRYPSYAELQQQFDAMQDSGEIIKVQVEGLKGPFYMLGEDQPHLEDLLTGRIPAAWQPIGPTTSDEVTFLAPLDIVSARGRAKPIFDFEYIWEVYKPADKRRWGYYVLPVLYGDHLVARIDPKLDRKTKTLYILGFWAEDSFDAHHPAFVVAFGRGLANFAQFHDAASVNLDSIADATLRAAVSEVLSNVGRRK